MQQLIKAPRGTQDALPDDIYKLQYIEECAREACRVFGYREIRTPVFENTELFNRSVGDTTDVVQKEMYTFNDKGGRSITLRPEGTAGAVRALLEHGLYNGPLPLKAYYLTSCYRYEKPQAGRLREFHQFGAECFGSQEPSADVEIIMLAKYMLDSLGIRGLRLTVNSIGCPTCRAKYNEALRAYFEARRGELCETCLSRLERNPMRILDCKSEICSKIGQNAPVMLDYLCEDCSGHFEKVKSQLDALGVKYEINPRIVRGLDYYTKTVFEFISDEIGAQGTVCGGGRYDGLVDELGGVHLPSLGFAMGIERLQIVMEKQCLFGESPKTCDLFLVSSGGKAHMECVRLASQLRGEGVSVQYDLTGRSVKAQMKYAGKLGAAYTCVIGDSELDSGTASVKNMDTGASNDVSVASFARDFVSLLRSGMLDAAIRSDAVEDLKSFINKNM